MTRRQAVLLLAVWVALVAVSVSVARPTKTAQGGHVRRSGTTLDERRLEASPRRRGRASSLAGPSHYWRLERKYVAQQHRMGRLGAEVRRLRRQVAVRRLQERLSAVATIRLVFGPTYGDQAVTVSSCETGGTFDPAARNGQYHGVLQMGTNERRTYGESDTVLGQALAAYRYFAATGYDWSPWECRP